MLSNHAHLITYVTGVWLLEVEVFIKYCQRAGREEPGQTHNSIILCLKDTHFQSSVDWPPEAYKQSHKNHTASTRHTTPSRPFYYTTDTRAHLISCVGGATPPPHNHTHSTPSLPFLWSHSPHNHTTVGCLINCHGLTIDLLPRPRRHLVGVKVHTRWETRPPIVIDFT